MKKIFKLEALIFIISLFLYFLIARDNIVRLNDVLFSSPDAVSYGQVSNWLFRKSADYSNLAVRPFLYPLFLGLRYVFSGYGIWFIQAVLFFVSAWLTYKAVFAFTGRKILAILSYLFIITNISLQLLTTHALTEIFSLFLVSVWIYVFGKTKKTGYRNGFLLLFLLSLLTVVRPVFIVGLLLYSFYYIGWCLSQKRLDQRKIGIIILCLAPVLIQMVLMKAYFNSWQVSNISSYTLKNYLVSRVYALNNNLPSDLSGANKAVSAWSDTRVYAYMLSQLPMTIKTYVRSIIDWNLLERTNFSKNPLVLDISQIENNLYMLLHVLFGIGIVFVMKSKSMKSCVKKNILVLYAFSSVIILTSGISFWQGDRLVVTALPLWLTAYALVASQLPIVFVKNGWSRKSS